VLNGSLAWTEGIARYLLVVGVPVAIELGASWRRSVSGRRLMIYWPEMVLWLPTVSYRSQVAVIWAFIVGTVTDLLHCKMWLAHPNSSQSPPGRRRSVRVEPRVFTMSSPIRRALLALAGFAVVVFFAISASAQMPGAGGPPPVSVAKPIVKEIVEWDEFVGRFEAPQSVEVRARVDGYLETSNFREGVLVKEGDLLFVIDKRPYQAAYNRA
jgi:hypothetical protein